MSNKTLTISQFYFIENKNNCFQLEHAVMKVRLKNNASVLIPVVFTVDVNKDPDFLMIQQFDDHLSVSERQQLRTSFCGLLSIRSMNEVGFRDKLFEQARFNARFSESFIDEFLKERATMIAANDETSEAEAA